MSFYGFAATADHRLLNTSLGTRVSRRLMWGGFNVFKAMKTVIFHMLTATHFIQCLSSNVKALRNGEVFLFGKQFFLRAESLEIVKVIKREF